MNRYSIYFNQWIIIHISLMSVRLERVLRCLINLEAFGVLTFSNYSIFLIHWNWYIYNASRW